MRRIRDNGPLVALFVIAAAWLGAQAYTVYLAGMLTGWRL